MNARARATVFWPGIFICIRKTREHCNTCWRMAPSQPYLPPATPSAPTYPFAAITTDYCDFGGHHYLIVVDRFSRFSNWPEIIKIVNNSNNSGSTGLINSLRRYFSIFGVPEEMSSDGGPEFVTHLTLKTAFLLLKSFLAGHTMMLYLSTHAPRFLTTLRYDQCGEISG